MIDVNDAIQLFLSEKDTYYSLWVFYFTSSAAVLGFIYGGTNNSQFITTIATSLLYFMIVISNSNAIFTTQTSLATIKTELVKTINESKDLDKSSNNINTRFIVSQLDITVLDSVKKQYYLSCILVFFGIWLPYVINVRRNGFKSTII